MHITHILHRSNRAMTWLLVAVTVMFSVLPFLARSDVVKASQITSRSVAIADSRLNAQTTASYGFTLTTAGVVQTMMFQLCTTALGACVSPGEGSSINQGTQSSKSGWEGAQDWVRDAVGAGDCTPAANVLCVDRVDVTSENADAKTLVWSAIDVPSTTAGTYFIRITTYSDVGWVTDVDDGTVAFNIGEYLNITARVQEILDFCVGDAETVINSGDDCSDVSGTDIDMGALDQSVKYGDTYGYAMVRTNASVGAVISYFAENGNGNADGHLAKAGVVCTPDSLTDRCINSVGTTEAVISAGVEDFGFTVDSIDTTGSSAPTANLDAENDYDNGTGYAFDGSGDADFIANTTSDVVDDEMLVLEFAATAGITTPTGYYDTTLVFIATPTY